MKPGEDNNGSILAIDIGTHTGWALQDHSGCITSGTISFTP